MAVRQERFGSIRLVKSLSRAVLISLFFLLLFHFSGSIASAVIPTGAGTVNWAYGTGNSIESSPAIGVDGTVYVGSNDNNLYAIGPDGALKWSYETGGAVGSSPAIGTDGTIYVGSYDGNLYAIKPDGTLRWTFATPGSLVASPAIGMDGTIYIGSGIYSNNFLYAINPDGTLRWSYLIQHNGGYSAPAIGSDGTIYVGYSSCDFHPCLPINDLYAIFPDGSLKWRVSTGIGFVGTSSPAIGPDKTIYIGSGDHNLYAVNPDGTLKWTYETSGAVNSSPAIGSDGTVYVGSSDNNVYAVEQDGTLAWSFATSGPVNSSPAIASDGTVHVGSDDGSVYSIRPDGTLRWSYATGDAVASSPAISTDGIVYVGSADGNLYAISATAPLANSPWPMFHRGLKHRADARAGISFSQSDFVGTWICPGISSGDAPAWISWDYGIMSADTNGVFTQVSDTDKNGSCNGADCGDGVSAPTLNCSVSPAGMVNCDALDMFIGTMSMDKNTMVFTNNYDGGYELHVCMRKGGAFETADLAGTWNMHSIFTGDAPAELQWEYYTFSADDAGIFTVLSDVTPDGSNPPGEMMNFSITDEGEVTADVDPTFHGIMSADKKMIVGYGTDESGSYVFHVFQKGGGAFTTSDLEGTWYMHSLSSGDSPQWVGWDISIFTGNSSGIFTQVVEGASDGTFPGDVGSTGTLYISDWGEVTVDGDPTFHGVMSLDKNTIVGTSTGDDGSYTYHVLQRGLPVYSVKINGGAPATKSTAVMLNIRNLNPIAAPQICISNGSSCTSWVAFAPTKSWTLATGNGMKTVKVWFKDQFGNITQPYSASILLDTTVPANGTVSATPGAGTISLNWSGFSDGGSGIAGYKVVFATGSAPASCSAGTPLPEYDRLSTSYTHGGLTNLTYGYRVCAIDNAGNVSSGATVSAKPLASEANPPTGGSIQINAGASSTKSAAVTLTLTADDASLPIQMCISNTSSCTMFSAFAATKSWTLPTGNGTKTVNVWFKDAWGNKTAVPYSASILLDTTAPTNGSIEATPGAGQIALKWSGFNDAGSGLAGYKVVFGRGTAPASCSAGTVVPGYDGTSATYTHTGLMNATYAYRICAIDNAGNVSTGATAAAKPLPSETNPPTGGSIQINVGASYAKSAAVTLTLTADDASLPIQMCISNTDSCTLWGAFAATKSWTLSTGNGMKTVKVWLRDTWGNTTPVPYSASIFLDTTAPTNGTVTPTAGAGQITLNWSGFSDGGSGMAGYKVVFAKGITAPFSCSAGTAVPGYDGVSTTYTHTGLTSGATYSYRVCGVDNAGNVSSGKTATAKVLASK